MNVWKKEGNNYVEEAAAANYKSGYYSLQQSKKYPMKQKLDTDNKPITNEDGTYKMEPDTRAEVYYKVSPMKFIPFSETLEGKNYQIFCGFGLNGDRIFETLDITGRVGSQNKPMFIIDGDNVIEDNLTRIYNLNEKNKRQYFSDIAFQEAPNTVDYREIIYQIAYDYYQHGDEIDY